MKKWLYKLAFNFIIDQHFKWYLNKGTKGIRLSFQNVSIPKADFKKASMEECEFNHASLDQSCFLGAYLSECDFSHAKIERSKFTQTSFLESDMSEANLRQVTHQIHIRNRQKEDLIRIFEQVDKMPEGDQRFFKNFLNNNEIQRPR